MTKKAGTRKVIKLSQALSVLAIRSEGHAADNALDSQLHTHSILEADFTILLACHYPVICIFPLSTSPLLTLEFGIWRCRCPHIVFDIKIGT